MTASADADAMATEDVGEELAEYLGSEPGVFIEAGAHDGLTLSNTVHLERDQGWTGVLVEPIPDLAAACRTNRPGAAVAQVALVDAEYPGDAITVTFGGLQSLVRGARPTEGDERAYAEAPSLLQETVAPYRCEAPVRTLSRLVDDYRLEEITLLSLDVEGYEAQALRGLDLSRHRPTWLLVEVWWWEADAIHQYLRDTHQQAAVLSCCSRSEARVMAKPDLKAGCSWNALYRAREQ